MTVDEALTLLCSPNRLATKNRDEAADAIRAELSRLRAAQSALPPPWLGEDFAQQAAVEILDDYKERGGDLAKIASEGALRFMICEAYRECGGATQPALPPEPPLGCRRITFPIGR